MWTPIRPTCCRQGSRTLCGSAPRTETEVRFLADGWNKPTSGDLVAERMLARDAYDNCLAYLDERLGELFDDLERRGVLDQTLVIVTADHGEGLGEHGLFDHGESLYRTEIGVPLLFVLPADRGRSPAVGHRVRQPPRHRHDHRRIRPPGDEVAVPGPVAARAVPDDAAADRRRAETTSCSPSWRRPIRPIRTRVDRPPIAAR